MKSEGQRQSQKHEKRLAKKYDGQVSAASGAFWSRKGDVRSIDLLIEHKYTSSNKSITIKKEWLDKIEKEAILDSRLPVLMFHLGGKNYAIVLEDDFDEIRGHDA